MANTLNIQTYDHKSELIQAVAKEILEEINFFTHLYGEARILLSGGGTPGPIYKELDTQLTKNQRVVIGLVDERYVPFESEYSNEQLIWDCFPKLINSSGKLMGMVYNLEDEESNIRQVTQEYQLFFDRTDIILLGMGEDGHFASIFPNDPASEGALRENSQPIVATRAPNFPNQRITFDLNTLCKAESVYLVITGEKKLNLLLDSALNLPIHKLLSANNKLKIVHSK